MTDGTIATINGTMLVPGVSLNRRLYTPELIGKTVKRMQERIADPNGLPIVMRTHHDAGDDSKLIVGRIADVQLGEGGVAKYRADLYDTAAGRDIAALATPNRPALRSTSIHGYWLGPVKRVEHDGQMVETADDLDIDAIDFTHTPGVTGAVLDLAPSGARESVAERTPIQETLDVMVTPTVNEIGEATIEAKDPKKPYGDVQYADPGYQKDGKKRYPLDSEKHIRAAWSYINQKENASQYTPKQLARIKAKIQAAMKRIGADVSKETAPQWGELREYYPDGPDGQAGLCIDVTNGPTCLSVRCCGVDPGDLRKIATAAMGAACDALQALDPDMDADIDVPGTATFNAGESVDITVSGTVATGQALIQEAGKNLARGVTISIPPQATPAIPAGASTTGMEPTVSEATETAAGTTVAPTSERTLTDADIQALGAVFAIALKENTAPAVPVAETAPVSQPPATPTTEQAPPKVKSGKKALKEAIAETMPGALQEAIGSALGTAKADLVAENQKAVAAAVEEATTKLRNELREEFAPGVQRRGFRVHENDQGDPTPDAATAFEDRAQILLGDFAKTPVPHAGTGYAPAPTAPAATG